MNYTELRAASIAYADRYDTEVSGNIDTYVIMTEARINRLLKTRKQSARAYILGVDGKEYYPLPPDWAGMRNLKITNPNPITTGYSEDPMSLLDPTSFELHKKSSSKDGAYCIIDNQIQVYPLIAEGCSMEMVYFQRVPNLNAIDDTNWLSTDNPDIYLAGMTAEISLFAKDYSAADGWYERLATAVGELENVDWVERWSGDPLQIRLG